MLINNESSSELLQPYCDTIEKVLLGSDYFVMHIQLLLLGAELILICILFRYYGKHRIAIHGNLRLLFANILALYFIHSLAWFVYFMRYRILLYTYSNACDLLSPVWMVPVFMGPYQVYSVAYPSFHFAVTFERIRATFLAHKYEKMGPQLIIKIICAIWLGSLAYLVVIVCFALADRNLWPPPRRRLFDLRLQRQCHIFGDDFHNDFGDCDGTVRLVHLFAEQTASQIDETWK
uniref:G protein-coupled receptor n=1 Tax=Globodera rostochiensis TaxID=31243 RepID=A0A914HXN8_GLORO